MKIVFDKKIPLLEERLRQVLSQESVVGLAADEITSESVRDADALIVRTRTRCNSGLLNGSRVKFLGTATIGTDHIDTDWCSQHGITVRNAPGCNAPAVMQYVASSLFSAGFNPQKDVIGVVGKGNIGSLLVRIYRDAGTEVLVSDPVRKEAGFNDEDYLSIGELLARSTAVTLHVPLTFPHQSPYPTFNLINENARLFLSRGGILVNASRGRVVNPSVLASGNATTRLIIDTWPFEDDLPKEYQKGQDCPVSPKNFFVATPHIAGYSLQGKERATRSVIEALNSFFNIHISAEGLADYDFRNSLPPLDKVISSYDPLEDSRQFKSHPSQFEILRNNYKLRNEA